MDVKNLNGVLSWQSGMAVDADGAANAYKQGGGGLDDIRNAQGKDGSWCGVVVGANGQPVVQGNYDPCPGFLVSPTSLRDHNKALTDPTAYVDAAKVPYFTACPELRAMGVHFGDVGIAHYAKTGKTSAGVVADGCPHSHYGESSIAMAEALGVPASPRNGGCDSGVTFVIFPGSSKGWPRSNADVAAQVGELLSARPDLQKLLTG